MSGLLAQQMSFLQAQQMSCLQTIFLLCGKKDQKSCSPTLAGCDGQGKSGPVCRLGMCFEYIVALEASCVFFLLVGPGASECSKNATRFPFLAKTGFEILNISLVLIDFPE